MARIVLEVTIVEDGVAEQPVPYRMSGGGIESDQAHQVAREMLAHFRQVMQENPAARAVADTLAHPEPTSVYMGVDYPFAVKAVKAMGEMGKQARAAMDNLVVTQVFRFPPDRGR